jgi:hypothetical protein
MPDVPWAGCSGKERSEQHIVEQEAIGILVVKLEWREVSILSVASC